MAERQLTSKLMVQVENAAKHAIIRINKYDSRIYVLTVLETDQTLV
jgi:hypothetical protein